MKKHIRTDHRGQKIYRCSICGNYFLKKGLLEKHNADVHEGKKAPMSKKKKSNKKEKKKHLNVENVAEVSAEKSGKKKKNKKSDISPVKIFKIFKGSSLDKIKGYGY